MCASGLLDVDYRVVLACRDGSVKCVRRGFTAAKLLVRLSSQCVAMALANTNIVVATMDHSIQCYSKSGSKQWVCSVGGAVTALATVSLAHQGVVLTAVALKEGAVHFYSGRDLVDVITASDTVSAIMFGQFGQEEHSLIMVTVGGCLMVKILKRTAVFSEQPSSNAHIAAQQSKLAIPKKTRLFLEQAARERESHADVHRTFQHDLFRLRLNAARSCALALQQCSNPVSADAHQPIKMSAQVLGLGPTFKLLVTLENMAASKPICDLAITFHCDEKTYVVQQPFIKVPMMVPALTYKFETIVECISELGISDEIRIFIIKLNQSQPLLAALINMPICDVLAST